jgi:hypothetical protein
MNTRHSRRISRSAAKSLLDGHAPPDLESLARVLAAAAAPARDSELTGEQLAVAAFEASHLNPVTTSHREHTSMLAKLLTAKVLVASAATALATGGVALAATTGAIPGTGSAPTTTTASQPATKPTFLITPGASAHPQPVTAPTAQPGQVISTPP